MLALAACLRDSLAADKDGQETMKMKMIIALID